MTILVKLGGSVITDKTGLEAPDLAAIRLLATELRAARAQAPGLPLIIGHGSGSYGHPAARRYGVHLGLAPDADWSGFAATSAAALRLNRIVVDELLQAGLPALSLQPAAAIATTGGVVTSWGTRPLELALAHNLLPVIHGDVAFDDAQGSAIVSTEALFTFLALHAPDALRPTRIVLVGEPAVCTADPRVDPQARPIPVISSANIASVLGGAGGSHGVDVTGGMRGKLELMWRLVSAVPGLEVHLVGAFSGLVSRAILGQAPGEGTLMHR